MVDPPSWWKFIRILRPALPFSIRDRFIWLSGFYIGLIIGLHYRQEAEMSKEKGLRVNTLVACIAMLLGMELGNIPEYDDKDWLEQYNHWLGEEKDMELMRIDPDVSPAGLSILCWDSVAGLPFCVIAEGGTAVYDPHPTREGEVMSAEYFLILRPLGSVG